MLNDCLDPYNDTDVLAWAISRYTSLMVAVAHIIAGCDLQDNVDSFAMNLQVFIETQIANSEMDR